MVWGLEQAKLFRDTEPYLLRGCSWLFPPGIPGKASCCQRTRFGTDWTLQGAHLGGRHRACLNPCCNTNSKFHASGITTYTCSNSVAGEGGFQPDTALCCWDPASRSGGGRWAGRLISQPRSGSVQPVAIFQPSGSTRKWPGPLGQGGTLDESAARLRRCEQERNQLETQVHFAMVEAFG